MGPAYGIIDRDADITIMSGGLFRNMASAACLKRNFKKADKTSRTYNQKSFHLHGRMDLDVAFGDSTMHTPIYMKKDAPKHLPLLEGVCRQLSIITYHPYVQLRRLVVQVLLPIPVKRNPLAFLRRKYDQKKLLGQK